MSGKGDMPAFPLAFQEMDGTGCPRNGMSAHNGMTLRQWFAGQALAGMNIPPHYQTGPCDQAAVARCFALADLMMEAEKP